MCVCQYDESSNLTLFSGVPRLYTIIAAQQMFGNSDKIFNELILGMQQDKKTDIFE